jgi:hypothetical protein
MAKKYIVRDGFVVVLKINKPDGTSYERTTQGGEEISLEDDDAALHQHKLELASQKERDAALEAERKATVAAAARQNPVDLVTTLVAALGQQQAAASAPAPAA